jgi:murein DD-endopeptidase MepM/ murein hydrolase activator NlpD
MRRSSSHLAARLAAALIACALAAPASRAPAAIAAEPEPLVAAPAPATQAAPIFGLPFADPSGPSTWLLGQPYGNTTTAFRWRVSQYAAGQGLHFGIDLSARCGTTVVAVGDGVVMKVDAMQHGAGPHNLMIDHGNGYASFYGHLYERPRLTVGEPVARGQAVALTGDPDLTCSSRPHLHLEIRDAATQRHAYNPVPLIAADWDALMLSGPSARAFARDLDNPRQWQYLDDQPDVDFGGPIVNHYTHPWPLEWNSQ